MINVHDFVVLIENTSGVEVNSVGFVKEINGEKAKVFFIGKLKEVLIDISKINF